MEELAKGGNMSRKIPKEMYVVVYEFYKQRINEGIPITKIAEEFNKKYETDFAESSLRNRYEREKEFKETLTFNERTDKIIDHPQKLLTEEDLLVAMGLDTNEFELNKHNTINKWWSDIPSETLRRIRSGQIKLSFKKKEFKLTEEVLEEMLEEVNVEHKYIAKRDIESSSMIELPLYDLHFGINTFEDYAVHVDKIVHKLERQEGWNVVVFNVGHDLFHNDNIRGTTSRGTPIEKVDMMKAWMNALKFYSVLFESAIANADEVYAIYTRGNHDEMVGWTFCQALSERYPQVKWDLDLYEEHKAISYGKVFLGYTHGDKLADKNIIDIFNAKYRLPMAKAERRIIKRGHKHTRSRMRQDADYFGTDVFALGTPAKTDQWHSDQGFVGNNKAMEIFTYTTRSLEEHIIIDNKTEETEARIEMHKPNID